MRIAVIGAGRVGSTLGGRWAEVGHDVVYGVRDLEHLAALWIRLAYPLGQGPDIAFALLRR